MNVMMTQAEEYEEIIKAGENVTEEQLRRFAELEQDADYTEHCSIEFSDGSVYCQILQKSL